MRDILEQVERWHQEGLRSAGAQVIAVEGSGPREPGAAMAVNERGEVVGSVSGGCVEGAVVAEAKDLLLQSDPRPRLMTFGYSDDDAFEVGLTCGGTVHIFLEGLGWWQGPLVPALREAVSAGTPTALVTEVAGPAIGAKLLVRENAHLFGTLGNSDLDRVVERNAEAEVAAGRSTVHHYGRHGEARRRDVTVFIESFLPPPRMVIFGAVDFTAALARAASFLGFRVTVCDPRSVFATPERFPMADEVVVDWPHRFIEHHSADLTHRDALCVLTHDEKFDIPAIVAALETEVGYIGAMGSRRTHERRIRRLRKAGVDTETLASRLMSPIGIDIGGRTPEEVAIAICAEIVAVRAHHRRQAVHLRDTEGPVHRRNATDNTDDKP